MDLQEYIGMWTDWWTEFVRKKKSAQKKGEARSRRDEEEGEGDRQPLAKKTRLAVPPRAKREGLEEERDPKRARLIQSDVYHVRAGTQL